MTAIGLVALRSLAVQIGKVDSAQQALLTAKSAVAQCWGGDPSRLDLLHQEVWKASADGERERQALVSLVRNILYGPEAIKSSDEPSFDGGTKTDQRDALPVSVLPPELAHCAPRG
ncbi:putative WXG100 family type VII secretion target [Pseudomonas zeae]